MKKGIFTQLASVLGFLCFIFSSTLFAATVTWVGNSGDWANTTNWSTGTLPGPSDDVVINPAATITVTHSTGAHTVHSITISESFVLSGGSLAVTTTLIASNTVTLSGGTLQSATVITTNGVSMVVEGNNGSTLNGVTVDGTLDVGNAYNESGLTVLNGLILNGTMLVGNPTNSWWGAANFSGTQGLGGTGTVMFGNQNPYYNALFPGTANTTLTISNGVTIAGQNGTVGYGSWWGGSQTITVINQGTIAADVNGGTINVNGEPFINQGLAQGLNGGTVSLSGSVTNTGILNVIGGGLSLGGTWTNSGAIDATNGTVTLGGSYVLADWGTFNAVSNTINLTGTLNNTNTTLVLNPLASDLWVLAGGTIQGGSVQAITGASLIVKSGTLDGVTMQGTLDIGNSYNEGGLTVLDGLTLNGTMLLGNPTNSWWGAVNFSGTQTLGGTGTVIFGNQNPYYNALFLGTANTTLTIGNGITIEGQNGTVGYGSWWGGAQNITIINQGAITAEVNGGTIDINGQPVLNQGLLAMGNGGQLNLQGLAGNLGQVLANGGGLTLSGTYTNNSTLTLNSNQTLTLNGNWFNAGTISATNTTINLGGTFTVSDLGTFNRNGGTVDLTGTLDNTNTVLLLDGNSWGTWILNGGTIEGGTVETTNGASLIVRQGTLNGVTMDGTLDVGNTYNESGLTVVNNLTLNGTMLMGNPTNEDWGAVNFSGTQTLGGNGTVIFGNQNPYYNALVLGTANTTLMIGNGITITGQNGTLGYGSWWGGSQSISIINDGTILDDVSGGTIDVNAQTFSNQGLLSAINGGQLNVQGMTGYIGALSLATSGTVTLNGTYTNNSVLNVTNGAALNLNGNWVNAGTLDEVGGKIGFGGTWINSGTIDATNGTVTLGGSYVLADFGTFNAISNTIYLTGTLDNTNTTFVLDPQVSGTWVLDGGTILGGTVQTTNGASLIVQGTSSTMNGVTMNGTLDVGNTYNEGALTVLNGLTLNGTMLMGNPTNANWGAVNFSGTQTLGGNGTVIFGNQNPYYNALFLGTANTTLTIGSGITITGQNGTIGYGSWWGGSQNISIINDGTLSDDVSGGTIDVNAQAFGNQGVLSAINGGQLSVQGLTGYIGAVSLATSGTVTLNGTYTNNSVLNVTNGATLNLNGNWVNTGTLDEVGGRIGFGGTWINSGIIDATNGTVTLGGSYILPDIGTFNAISNTIYLTGTLDNTNTTLVLDPQASGTWVLEGGTILGGTLQTTNGASLIVQGTSSTMNGVTMNGTLDVGNTYNEGGLTVVNGLTLNGTMLMGNPTNENWGGVNFSGTQTFGGNGTVIFGNQNPYYNALFLGTAGSTLTIGSGITVTGQNGIVGYGSWWGGSQNISIVNQGAIAANVNGGTIEVNAEPFVNLGTLSASAGTLSLNGTNNLSGTLDIGIASPSIYGHVNFAGNVSLGGIGLNVTLNNGYQPNSGSTFSILGYGSVSSVFSSVNFPSSGLLWQENYGAAGYTLTTTNSVTPAVYLTSPANNTILASSTNIAITAIATNTYAPISSVSFFEDGNPIGTSSTYPYGVTWSNAPAGIFGLTAQATDTTGATGTSLPIYITVLPTVSGTNFAWTGRVSTAWTNSGNWSPTGVPGINDSATIANGGTVTISNAVGVAFLSLVSGTINGPGLMNIAGSGDWTGGEMACPIAVLTNGVLNIGGSGTLYLLGGLTNAGTINWAGTANLQIYNYNGNSGYFGGINNLSGSMFNAQNDQSVVCACYGYEYFNNAGTIVKSPTTGTTTINVPFTNTGQVIARTGTITFNDGGAGNGQFAAATGANLIFAGGTMTLAGPLQNVTFSGGTLDESGSISNLTWIGGTLGGNSVFSGTTTWTGGELGGNSTLTIATNGVFDINGGGTLYLLGAVTNAGTINWTGTANLQIYNYNGNDGYIGGINNLAGAVFNARNDQSIVCACYGYEYFNNAGTIIKSPTTGTTTINVPFNSTGTVEVESGTIAFNDGGTSTGPLVAAAGADTYIGGGTMALYGLAQNLIFSGGTINEFGSISNLTWTGGSFAGNGTVGGTATWTGGQLGGNSTLTIATNGVLNIGGNGTLYLYGALTNAGTINWTGTANLQIYNYNGNDGYIGGINNLAGAVFNAENDQSINCACYGYEYFNNAGTFTKRPTTGTTTIGVPFNNTGAVNIESGSVNLNSGHVLAGGSLGFWISGATNYTRLNLSGSTALSGALNVNMNPGYAPGPSNSFALVTYGSESGTFASLNLPDLINSRTNYGPTAFTVTLGYPKSILGWFNLGYATNGTYTIDPSGSGPFSVSALMTVSGGGWTELNSNVAASVLNTDTNMSRAYLYVQSGTDLYYRTPVSQLPWSWTSGQDLYGTYYYSGTSGESSFVVTPSGEHEAYGVGGSSGGGTTYKCLVAYSGCLDPENAQVELCQDLPGIFGSGCQCGVTVYFRENLPVIESNSPVIVFQPTNQFAWVGSNAQFNVIASGSVPLFYQWQFDGTNLGDGGQISGSESNVLTISSATTNDAGGFSVVVTNYFGSVTSLVASLTVSNLPDLAPVSVSAPGFTSGGLEVSCVVTNQGLGGVSGPWYDGLWVTTNAVFSESSAINVGYVFQNHNVPAGSNYTWTTTANVPQAMAGAYSLYVVIDDPAFGDVVYEVTKTNNISSAIALSAVTPDLAPVSVGLPASGVAGTSIQVSCVVTNQGTGSASGPWADGIYFTSNAVPNVTNATLLTSVYENHGVTANGSYAWTNSVTLPQVPAGTYYLFVVVDDPSVYGDVVYEVTKTNNVSAPVSLQIGSPDLAINNISGPANAVIAQPVQLILTITNQGTANAVGPWQNQILIANNPNGIAAQTLGTFTSTNILTPGNFVVVTQTVILPTTIEGTQYFGLFVNSAGTVPELNRSNNVAFANSPVFITGPDLDMEQLNVSASAQLGQNFTVTYAVTNVGGASATANWNDEIYLSSSPNALSGATLLASVPGTSPLASGTGYTTAQTVSVPLMSSSTPGNFYIIAVANGNDAQLELTRTNNELVAPISITLPPLPDLAAGQVTSPTTAGVGESVPLSWAVINIGDAEAAGPWQESVYLLPANISQVQFATNANAYTLLNRFTFTNDLAPGESLTRTQQVEIPSTGLSGNLQVGVYVNSADTFVEQNETNNAALALNDILVPAALSLDVPFTSVSENTPNPNIPCLVLRNGDLTQAAVVSLASVPGNNLTVPASVTIPAGVATAPFTMSVVNNGQPGPNVVDSISANADDYLGATSDVTIVNNNVPGLALSLASTQVTMGQSVTATLTSTTTNSEPVLVSINGSSSTALNVPVSVTIPADSNSVAFTVTAAQTSVIAPQNYTVSASASGYASGSANLTVLNDNTPALTLSLVPTNINEADGPFAAIGTISYQPISSQPLTIALTSTNTSGAIVPAQIVIPALTGSATFYVAAVNDTNITGPKVTLISAQALDNQGDPVGNPASESLVIQDNNGPVLRMSVASAVVPKGANPATIGTVWTTTPPTNDLIVALTSSETSEATVPLTITIPAGQTNAIFDIVSLDDGLPLTSQTFSLTASATNYASGSAVLTVSDPALALPDLVIQDITAPASVYTDQPLTIDFQLVNQGLGPLTNDVTQNIYLTTNAVSGPYVLIGTSDCATLGPGTSTNESVFIPSSSLPSPGIYWVVVTANADNSAQELTEANNSAASSSPIAVAPEYSATVQTTVTNVLMGTPIPLSGSATRTVGGPATNVPVNILVTVRGLTRTISVITDVNGNFTTVFNPLATEAGTYTIIAVLPGITAGSPQGEFNILGISANPSSATLNIGSGGNVVANITLNNLSDVPLTDLTATISGLAANLTASATLSENELEGQSSLNVSLNVAASDASILQSSFTLQLASAEGVVLDVPLSVTVTPPQPQLVVSPTQLRTSMLVGGQTIVQFEVANNGGAESGTLAVALPSVPWMNIASGNTLPSLAPGESNLVTLVLTPSTNVALGPYTGNLAVNGNGVSVQVPFSLDAVSDAHGSVLIQSVDELTFFSSNAPPLTNASVTLTDPFSGDVVASGVTDTNGLFLASGLMAGTYALSVTAPQHSAYNGEAVIQASETNTIQAFLSLDSVTYTWTVTPTQVQVQNQITVTTTFETDVPDPVIVPTPASLDLSSLTQPGQYMDVPLTLANEGLIGVQNVSIGFASSDLYQFDIVTTNIGNLPAHGTVTIPLRVTYLGQNIASSIARPGASPGGGDGPCTPSLGFTFSFPCGLFGISKSVELPLFNFLSDCTSPTPPVAQVTTYVTGPGVSPGGNGGPGGSISYSLPTYSPPTVCDCNLLPTLSAKGSVAFNLSGTQAKLLSMLTSVLPDFTVKVPDFGANFSGSISSCCYDNTPSWTMNASATLQCTVTMTAGPNFSIPTTSFSSPDPNLQNISVSASGFAGVQITADGTVTGTATRTCAGEYQACLNGKLGLSALAGGQITAKVTATEGGVNYSGQLQGTLGLNVAGSVTASGCIGGPSSVSACANLTATASLSGQLTASQGEGGAESTIQVKLGETVPIASSGKCSDGEVLSADDTTTNDNYAVTNLVLSDIVNSDTNIATALGLPTLPQSGVCAQIQLQLSQNAVLTENAFNATLQLSDQGSSPLTNIAVNVVIQNALGQDVTTLFDVQSPTIGGGLSAVDGTGVLTANGTGSAEWILIPTSAAAPQTSTNYLVSGSLSYTQNGVPVTIPLTPEPITVQPSPQLYLSYFIQQDVYGDDPFTPEIEPSIPFAMGLLVQNQGYGTANNFQITSSQPTIVDNKKGLLIGFNIIGTQVDGQPATPSLTANFGNIAPQQTAVGVWNLTSTLDGQFTAIKASYQAIDPLGKPSVSFIDGIQTHIMTHLVQAAGTWDDGLPDFLVIDNPNPQNLPDTVYLSSGPIEPVSDVQSGSTDNPVTTANLQVHFTADFPAGFSYVVVPDPANGQFGLTNILCSGGTSLLTYDFWMTYQTLQGVTQPPLLQTNLHLFVYHTNAGPDTYTLQYGGPVDLTDTNPPVSSVFSLPAESPQVFGVAWNGAPYAGGASIAYYDIYVSDDGGPFTDWQSKTTANSALFTGANGHTYAYYSVATDTTGNREAAPSEPQAETTVIAYTNPPTISITPIVTLNAGQTLSLPVTASDPNPESVLTFSLAPGAPYGATVNANTGFITWPTSPQFGGTTNRITVIVSDNSQPPLTATGTVSVFLVPVANPPILASIPNYTIREGRMLTFANYAFDENNPPRPLTFSLGAGSPGNASIDPVSGVFEWQPTEFQVPSTNIISVIVADNGNPQLSVEQTFTVIVREGYEYTLSLGSTNLLVGTTNSVPINLQMWLPLTNISAIIDVPSTYLTNVTLQPISSNVADVFLQPLGTNIYALSIDLNSATPQGTPFTLAQLGFTATSQTNSAIVPLGMPGLSALDIYGQPATVRSALSGDVFVIGVQPLLNLWFATNSQPMLTLYGNPDANYEIDYITNLMGEDWQVGWQFPMTNTFMPLNIDQEFPQVFYRAIEFHTNSDLKTPAQTK